MLWLVLHGLLFDMIDLSRENEMQLIIVLDCGASCLDFISRDVDKR